MKTYRAAPSFGWLWLVAVALLAIGPTLPALLAVRQAPVVLITVILGLAVGVPFLVMAFWFPTIRYELGPETLVLRYGPFRYTIRTDDIQEVTKRDLAFSAWSSMRLPGFAMWTVDYADEGNVFMCSTRALRDIIYIVTPRRKYGITPANEEEFLQDLTHRLKGA
ncbi:MAG: PH domain-containing protein [Bacillota bacterium]